MITAIRIVTPAGSTLFVTSRTRSGQFGTGEGAVSLVQFLTGLREAGARARLDVEGAAPVDIFDTDGGIRPEAAVHLAAEFEPTALAQAALLAEIARAASEAPVADFAAEVARAEAEAVAAPGAAPAAPDAPETADATS